MQGSQYKLYGNPICPFAHRAWIAAIEKGVPFDFKLIPLSGEIRILEAKKKEPKELSGEHQIFQAWVEEGLSLEEIVKLKNWYKEAINPVGEVPSVERNGHIIVESEICAEFLDQSFPNEGTHLVPADPYKAAKMRLGMKIWTNVVTDLYGLLLNQDPEKDSVFVGKIHSGIEKYFKLAVPIEEGPYFLGKEFSLADIHVIPFIDRFRHTLKEYRGFTLVDETLPWAPRYHAWLSAVEGRHSFKKTAKPGPFYVSAYCIYSHNFKLVDGQFAGRGTSTLGK